MTALHHWRTNDYRFLPTSAIFSEAESLLWDMAELRQLLDDGDDGAEFAQAGIDFLTDRIEQANAELARRERLRHRPDAPGWPATWPDRRAELDRIKSAIDLPQFVEQMFRVKLERRGKQLACRCVLPGHDDDTPSFLVSPAKQLWFCHGCGRGGDLFTLAMHYFGTDRFGDVVANLAEEARLFEAARGEARVG